MGDFTPSTPIPLQIRKIIFENFNHSALVFFCNLLLFFFLHLCVFLAFFRAKNNISFLFFFVFFFLTIFVWYFENCVVCLFLFLIVCVCLCVCYVKWTHMRENMNHRIPWVTIATYTNTSPNICLALTQYNLLLHTHINIDCNPQTAIQNTFFKISLCVSFFNLSLYCQPTPHTNQLTY